MTVRKYYYRESSLSFPNVLDLVDPLKKQGLIVKNVLKSQSRFCLCCFLKFTYAVEPLACERGETSVFAGYGTPLIRSLMGQKKLPVLTGWPYVLPG